MATSSPPTSDPLSESEWFLPLECSRVVERADGGPLQIASKRELYFRLCRSISVENGAKRYWLDRPTGAECYMLSARALSIVWGNDPRYWEWVPREGSWFPEVGYLNTVCWFAMEGTFREVLRPGTYTVSFRMQLYRSYGWNRAPVKLSVSTSNGHPVETERLFDEGLPLSEPPMFSEQNALVPASQDWVECDAGEFTVDDDEGAVEVQFSMKLISSNWKGGFFLDGVMVRPSHVVRDRAESHAVREGGG